jgi:hypothetical protein
MFKVTSLVVLLTSATTASLRIVLRLPLWSISTVSFTARLDLSIGLESLKVDPYMEETKYLELVLYIQEFANICLYVLFLSGFLIESPIFFIEIFFQIRSKSKKI